MAGGKEYKIVEVDEAGPQMRCHHMAVCVKGNILVFGGKDLKEVCLSCHVIWMFNVYTERWSKHVIPESEPAPRHSIDACAVAISDDVYVFGGLSTSCWTHTNALWTLKRTSETCYVWSEVPTVDNRKAPLPRRGHIGWEYAGHLWVFGGSGPLSGGHLNDCGEYYYYFPTNHGWNNQLLSFYPSSQEWTNPKSSGAIPSPRTQCAVTIVNHNVWLYGGSNETLFEELYKLNMPSLIWTQIQTVSPKPSMCYACTLSGTSETNLVLHEGVGANMESSTVKSTWILDIPSQTWKHYKSKSDHTRKYHTSVVGVNSCVVIIGGQKNHNHSYEDYSISFLIMLEPRSLQQLAMQMILKHRVELPWQHLPNKLIALLGISESDERTIEEPPTSTS